jgi:hypothetical protein
MAKEWRLRTTPDASVRSKRLEDNYASKEEIEQSPL